MIRRSRRKLGRALSLSDGPPVRGLTFALCQPLPLVDMRFDDESDGTTAPRLSRPKHSQSRGRNFVQSLIMSVTLVAIALLIYSSLAIHCSAAAPPEEFVIAGYLPDYRSYIDADRGSVHLTDLIVFSLSPRTVLKYEGGVPRDGCCLEGRHFDQARGGEGVQAGNAGDERPASGQRGRRREGRRVQRHSGESTGVPPGAREGLPKREAGRGGPRPGGHLVPRGVGCIRAVHREGRGVPPFDRPGFECGPYGRDVLGCKP
ncbi:hypothetical protein THAOC_19205 [Thalassiosira oceanica]|uniref:Uncharacterized protein n=1 Tax=Thalassiosira oceanica TaxID=159749 RepID=K0S6A8_THAOC|nr:hypothetical protein THAOC_19205 [Thalassiosira oceanica]|eukprot:EJK60444.1 hypothetical protein THAOC_19205 [Thalassiosira oceanica]